MPRQGRRRRKSVPRRGRRKAEEGDGKGGQGGLLVFPLCPLFQLAELRSYNKKGGQGGLLVFPLCPLFQLEWSLGGMSGLLWERPVDAERGPGTQAINQAKATALKDKPAL